MGFLDAEPRTPPVAVRLAMLAGYLYAVRLGLRCFCSPWALPDESVNPAIYSQHAICFLSGIYSIDAALAASPLHWCCMRSIPPKNIVQHHLPFVIGMAPSVLLAFMYNDTFREVWILCCFSRTFNSYRRLGFVAGACDHSGVHDLYGSGNAHFLQRSSMGCELFLQPIHA